MDALYMEAVQGMTGHGGWPLNVFLTPEQLPFYGGTYFPPEPRHGMPAWTQVLQAIAEAWSERSEEIRAGGERPARATVGRRALGALLRAAATRAHSTPRWQGSGSPSIPSTAASAARRSSRRPRSSSSCCCAASDDDGAARRCARWPRAASTTSSAAASRATASTPPGRCRTSRRCSTTTRCSRAPTCTAGSSPAIGVWREVCRDTLDWTLREMRGPEGGFYSALDADSEGVEGRFYVWTLAELHETPRRGRRCGDRVVRRHRAGQLRRPSPSRAGLNVLEDRGQRPDEAVRARIRARLLEARERRTRPGLDDKRLTAWNALMIAALADAGAALGGASIHSRRRSPAPSSSCATCATTPTGGCCAPTTTARRRSAATSRIMPSCWRR